ncbi:hypothetical protein AMTRI_Chr06g195570 [Amborella trichopoda]
MAIRECLTFGILTICLIDTNCDPDLADIQFPVNDDAMTSIQLILYKLVLAICDGHYSYLGSFLYTTNYKGHKLPKFFI